MIELLEESVCLEMFAEGASACDVLSLLLLLFIKIPKVPGSDGCMLGIIKVFTFRKEIGSNTASLTGSAQHLRMTTTTTATATTATTATTTITPVFGMITKVLHAMAPSSEP